MSLIQTYRGFHIRILLLPRQYRRYRCSFIYKFSHSWRMLKNFRIYNWHWQVRQKLYSMSKNFVLSQLHFMRYQLSGSWKPVNYWWKIKKHDCNIKNPQNSVCQLKNRKFCVNETKKHVENIFRWNGELTERDEINEKRIKKYKFWRESDFYDFL